MIGLLIAFISYVFWNQSQPALFYICPILLAINVLLSLYRKEFMGFWSGDIVIFLTLSMQHSFINFYTLNLIYFKINKYIDVNTGYTKNLKKYKVKKSNAFNLIKLGRLENIRTISGMNH